MAAFPGNAALLSGLLRNANQEIGGSGKKANREIGDPGKAAHREIGGLGGGREAMRARGGYEHDSNSPPSPLSKGERGRRSMNKGDPK